MDENTDVLVHDSDEQNPDVAATDAKTSDDLYANFVPKSRVTNIVKEQRALVADKIRREMEELHAQELAKVRAEQPNIGMEQFIPKIEEMVEQRMQEKFSKLKEQEEERQYALEEARRKEKLEEGVRTYHKKIAEGIEKIPELKEAIKDYDVEAFPFAALLAAEMENTPEIMLELTKDPLKAQEINGLANESTSSARLLLKKLSQSIAKNQEALENNIKTNAPLSRLKSSNVGADSGKMSLKDFKNADYNLG